MLDELVNAIVNMQEKDALGIANDLLENGIAPTQVLNACREAMNLVGGKFERGESFIPELVMAGEILSQISEIVKPQISGGNEKEKIGKVVIGTVQGDIHDIAKDIVVFMLDINGFEVFDLGVDVPSKVFIEKIKKEGAQILGLSGFLTLAIAPMKETVDLLAASGLAGKVKVMIGGGPIDEQVREYTGADAWGSDAMAAVKIARDWVGEDKT